MLQKERRRDEVEEVDGQRLQELQIIKSYIKKYPSMIGKSSGICLQKKCEKYKIQTEDDKKIFRTVPDEKSDDSTQIFFATIRG